MSNPEDTILITRGELETLQSVIHRNKDLQRVADNQARTIINQGEVIRRLNEHGAVCKTDVRYQNEDIARLRTIISDLQARIKLALSVSGQNQAEYRAEIEQLRSQCFKMQTRMNAAKRALGNSLGLHPVGGE